MRITSSDVGLAAASLQRQRQVDRVSEQQWGTEGGVTAPPAAFVARGRPGPPPAPVGVSPPAWGRSVAPPPPAAEPGPAGGDDSATGDARLDTTVSLLELMFGIKVRWLRMDLSQSTEATRQASEAVAAAERQQAVGGEIRIEHVVERDQRLEVAAHVRLTTADGGVVEADLAAVLEHSERVSSTTTIGWGAARPKDPLLLALDGGVPDLGDRTWRFDLDSDGRVESLAGPAAGTVLLGIDRDGDGAVTSGREVLGTRTGDAYAELAALDGDGNRWLDEADAAWSALRVVDASGASRTLAEAGVGAVSTAAVQASFTHGDIGDATGETREVGLFVRADGTLGVAARLDLLA